MACIPMRGRIAVWFLVAFAPAVVLAETNENEPGFFTSLKSDVIADFRYHYSWQPISHVLIGFGVAGVVANTNADAQIQEFFRDSLTGDAGDDLANLFTGVGDVAQPLYSVPIYLGTMWLGGYNSGRESMAAEWGANSLRAALVGAPQVVILSNVAGGSRPEEGEPGWDPFNDDDGVSGHAFFGAVPIITAAQLTDKRWLKYTLYASSTLPGLARVYDDKHYFSQSLLGWWIAYLSAESVEHTNRQESVAYQLVPVTYHDGGGVQLTVRF